MNDFRPMKRRYRATYSALPAPERVDTESETLYGVQICLEGEAKGHGVWLDREFIDSLVEAGNAAGEHGVKVRYGHPAMCADAIGTALGRASNFRLAEVPRKTDDGETVFVAGCLADVRLLKSAHDAPQGDIAAHVLKTAQEDPAMFGQSIVLSYADWVVKDADGNRRSYNAEVEDGELSADDWRKLSADGKVYAVLGKLHGTDFTDSPAATDGIFSTGTIAEQAVEMLDENPEVLDAIERDPSVVVEFLKRTGLDSKIESARLAGLQSAKDREINELHASLADSEARLTKTASDRDSLSAALEDAKAEIKQLQEEAAKSATALADMQAALQKAETRYREQVGLALRQPGTAPLHGKALVRSSFTK